DRFRDLYVSSQLQPLFTRRQLPLIEHQQSTSHPAHWLNHVGKVVSELGVRSLRLYVLRLGPYPFHLPPTTMRVLIFESNLMWSSRLVQSEESLGHEPLLRKE